MMEPNTITEAQQRALNMLASRWQFIGEPAKIPLEDAVSVCCWSDGTEPGTCRARVWYCIEPDGHAHT